MRYSTGVIRDYRWDKGNIIGFYNDTRVILDKIIIILAVKLRIFML